MEFIAAALVGIIVGILSGLLGIGGGTIMVPVFRLLFGMSPIQATATSLFTIIPTSISGLSKHLRNKTSLLKVGLLAGLAGAVISPLGVRAASVSPGWAIMGATACVIIYSSFTMFKKALAAPKTSWNLGAFKKKQAEGASTAETPAAAAKPAQPLVTAETFQLELNAKKVLQIVAIGMFAGFMSGYVGVGGGFIMVPMFIAILGVPMRLASGTSLVAVCILATPGVITQCIMGNVNYIVGLAMAAGTMPGAIFGANLVKFVPERTLRFIFSFFLVAMAVFLVVNEIALA